MHSNTTLMVQGTASDAGKSTLVAGIGRVLSRRGIQVAPFKPQNMALNSAVTAEGDEIGRSQAVQAQACRVAPTCHMNPILLKPHSDTGAQVIVQGQVLGNMDAQSYHQYKSIAMDAVMSSYRQLAEHYTCVLVEGAGSPAEINLRDRDIANMGFAEAADCNVILIADIDKGGVFAQIIGTMALLSDSEQARIKGFVINRFRGDIRLLTSGLEWLENKTGLPVIGVLPYLPAFHLEAEDAIEDQQVKRTHAIKIRVPVLERISNHTDFDPLRLHPDVDLEFVGPGHPIPSCDLIIIPGSKSVRQDFDHFCAQGWADDVKKHLRYGGKVLGICGGYQMLGRQMHDPDGVEGAPGSSPGLGLLDCETILTAHKSLTNITATLLPEQVPLHGYEIHAGQTFGPALEIPFMRIDTTEPTNLSSERINDGACTPDNQIRGTYLHGLFESSEGMRSLLRWAGAQGDIAEFDYADLCETEIDRLADTLEAHLNLDILLPMCGLNTRST